MQIIPAIDVYNGKVVRLTEGSYDQQKIYDVELGEMVDKYKSLGVDFIHVVDLNGAKGDNTYEDFILKSITGKGLKLQIGGGVRTVEKFKRLITAGVNRIILGTAAVKDPEFLKTLAADRLQANTVIGIDVKDETIMINGWLEKAAINLYDFIDNAIALGFKTFLCTDISKDGKLQGPSVELYKKLKLKYPNIELVASGGVAGMDDIEELVDTGSTSVVVGKAIYENRISIEQVVEWNGKQVLSTKY